MEKLFIIFVKCTSWPQACIVKYILRVGNGKFQTLHMCSRTVCRHCMTHLIVFLLSVASTNDTLTEGVSK